MLTERSDTSAGVPPRAMQQASTALTTAARPVESSTKPPGRMARYDGERRFLRLSSARGRAEVVAQEGRLSPAEAMRSSTRGALRGPPRGSRARRRGARGRRPPGARGSAARTPPPGSRVTVSKPRRVQDARRSPEQSQGVLEERGERIPAGARKNDGRTARTRARAPLGTSRSPGRATDGEWKKNPLRWGVAVILEPVAAPRSPPSARGGGPRARRCRKTVARHLPRVEQRPGSSGSRRDRGRRRRSARPLPLLRRPPSARGSGPAE